MVDFYYMIREKSSYGGRLMVFASDEQLKVLLQSDVLFADGTFKVTPKLFEQLYIIHGLQHGEGTSFFSSPDCLHLIVKERTERNS